MGEHTPGPWEVFCPLDPQPGIEATGVPFSVVIWGNYKDPADHSLGVQGRTSEETFANARLIAAAPELLEACKALRAAHDGEQLAAAFAVADVAIAKATGQ